MSAGLKYLVIQTAFPGDVVLTLPLAQLLARTRPDSAVDMLVTPRSADLLRNHPSVRRTVCFDKRGSDAGVLGLFRLAGRLSRERYDVALIPHRSLRSALVARLAGIPRRIGFATSSGRFLLTEHVPYDPHAHEIDRVMSLLRPLGIEPGRERPRLAPPEEDQRLVDGALRGWRLAPDAALVAVAPGSVWATKRWLPERFASLVARLVEEGFSVVLIGGSEDGELCRRIALASSSDRVMSMAGQLSLLQSAAMIARCALLVSNDSAPMHLAGAVGTPVIAIFGATAPSYGFAPTGTRDRIVETLGLACRPCAIHGGERCPITTFDCMKEISVERVLAEVVALAGRPQGQR